MGIDGAMVAAVAIRAAGYLCALIAAGTAAFVGLAGRHGVSTRPMRRLAAGAALAGIALLALGVVRRAAFLGGGTLTAAMDPALLTLVLESPFGTAAAVRAAGLLAASALILERRGGDAIAWAGSLAIVASFALSGHVLGEPRWALAPLIMVHTAAVAWWLAALPGLWLVTRAAATPVAAGIVGGFGRRAQWVVAALVAAGGGMLVLLAGNVDALVRSSWGLLIGAKLLVVAGLIAIAAYNKLRLTPALASGDPAARHMLRRTIAAELGLGILILVLTATLTTTPPPGN
ncbi:MAG: CopD family protein [Halofilum sp. (in: g-proteobacteria)]|nr:CopD family protein [Halofilum sp. (in: g-proteobacteria)]